MNYFHEVIHSGFLFIHCVKLIDLSASIMFKYFVFCYLLNILIELEKLQEKYTTLMKTSSEDQKSLRQAQRDLAKFNNEKSAQEQDKDATSAELENSKKKEEVRESLMKIFRTFPDFGKFLCPILLIFRMF